LLYDDNVLLLVIGVFPFQTRLIVSCMSNTTCDAFNWLLLPLFMLVVGVQTLSLGVTEVYLLWAYTLFVIAAHIHYGICVVRTRRSFHTKLVKFTSVDRF